MRRRIVKPIWLDCISTLRTPNVQTETLTEVGRISQDLDSL